MFMGRFEVLSLLGNQFLDRLGTSEETPLTLARPCPERMAVIW